MQAPLLQMLSTASGSPATDRVGQIKQAVAKIKGISNPQAALQQMMQQRNPQFMEALNCIKQHGGDGRAAFEALAKQQGVNISAADIEALMK